MNAREQLLKRADKAKKIFLPHISIDPVIFGFDQNELKVLLLKMKFGKQWFLPGGFVQKNEDLDKEVLRVLEFRAGITNVFVESFGVFGQKDRNQDYFKNFDDTLFFKQRFITIGYYALYNAESINPVTDELSEVCEWIYLHQLPEIELAMDHQMIIEKALLALREKIAYKPIGLNLLPEKFTLPELQKLYEAILGKKLNRGNFYRKIKNLNILQKLDERRKGGAHKSPDLYCFDIQKYNEALENGLSNW
ncbi:NUDIX hydrolase [Elizabethkingia bruuniana]|uniref:NUDIX hydrolase n=1 Tax=Elizabethkingia bruuniana TaxID=1756149 RepID=UPI000999699D|nr:NUDIX domain-containing protein [Elizabethkingia bruuniana]OPC66437.1 NUDIX hydrolase [Elizabethkingia bruuniana]